jgi:hypothetical protein
MVNSVNIGGAEGIANTQVMSANTPGKRDCMRAMPDCTLAMPDCVRARPDCMRAMPDCMRAMPDCMRAMPDCMRAMPDCVRAMPDNTYDSLEHMASLSSVFFLVDYR